MSKKKFEKTLGSKLKKALVDLRKKGFRSTSEMLEAKFEYKPRVTQSGKTVVNEVCTCGALRTSHERRFNHEASNGHGACERTECPQFTWEGFFFAEETNAE